MNADTYDMITGILFGFGVGLWIIWQIARAIMGVTRVIAKVTEPNVRARATIDEMYGYAATRAENQLRDRHGNP